MVDREMPDDPPEIQELEEEVEPVYFNFPAGEGIAVRNVIIQEHFAY